MIKLIKIIQEIKIHGKVTIDELVKLYSNLYNIAYWLAKNTFEPGIRINFYNKWDQIDNDYIKNKDGKRENFEHLNNKELNNYYNKLKSLYDKYINEYQINNLQEIKINPKVTPEMVGKLIEDILMSISRYITRKNQNYSYITKYTEQLNLILDKYDIVSDPFSSGNDLKDLERLNNNQLNKLYLELLRFKNKFDNINEIKVFPNSYYIKIKNLVTDMDYTNNFKLQRLFALTILELPNNIIRNLESRRVEPPYFEWILELSNEEQKDLYEKVLEIKNSLKEIKIIGSITPEIVANLYIEKGENSIKVLHLMKKYIGKIPQHSKENVTNIINKYFNQQQLNDFYKELQQL